MSKIKILLVEDEDILATVVKESLGMRGFEVIVASNGVAGWAMFHEHKPDVCIVDVMMPRKDGYSLVRDIRQVDEWVPIIFLTAKTQTEDVLKGLEAGGDDYMKKPFSMEELILRLHRLARRRLPVNPPAPSDTQGKVSIGIYDFDFSRLELSCNGQSFSLSQREAELLDLLLKSKNELLDRKTALLKIWGDDSVFNARSMDVYITRLRKFLAGDPKLEISNLRGRGYRLMDRH